MLKRIAVLGTVLGAMLTAQPAAADDASLTHSFAGFVKFEKVFDKQSDKLLSDTHVGKGHSLSTLKPALLKVSRVATDGRGLVRQARPVLVGDRASSRTGVRGRSYAITTLDTLDRAYRQLQIGVTGFNRAIRLERAHKAKATKRQALASAVLFLLATDSAEKAAKYQKKATKLFAQAARERAKAAPAG